MNYLYKKALLKADEVRIQLRLNMFQPINIFDSCVQLDLSVRFVNVNMEGMYIKHEDESQPTILLSNQRPLPRRIYTCGHELGHHVFGHGSKLDALSDVSDHSNSRNDKDEFLVDSFAGALLMPIAGVKAEFAKRNWSIATASPIQFYTVSSVFSTGYQTLITHCKTNNLINKNHADTLSKFTPAKILKSLAGTETNKSYFKIIDKVDHIKDAFQGFPCLQHISFYISENRGLILNSYYAIQYLYRRAYGNWLGLINLGKFVANEVQLNFERFNCYIGVEKLDELTKLQAGNLLKEIN